MRPLLVLLAALTTFAVVAGCGARQTNFSDTPPAASPSATGVAGTLTADVVAISEPRPGRFRLTVRTVGTAPGCVSKVETRKAFDDASGKRLEAVYTSSGAADCRGESTHVVRRAIGGKPRTLVVNDESWRPGSGTSWERCDASLGCNPPADRCTQPWIDELIARSNLPPERRIEVLSCGSGRLQLDVDADITGCQTQVGVQVPAHCKGTGVHAQWLATPDSSGRWRVVSSVSK